MRHGWWSVCQKGVTFAGPGSGQEVTEHQQDLQGKSQVSSSGFSLSVLFNCRPPRDEAAKVTTRQGRPCLVHFATSSQRTRVWLLATFSISFVKRLGQIRPWGMPNGLGRSKTQPSTGWFDRDPLLGSDLTPQPYHEVARVSYIFSDFNFLFFFVPYWRWV